MFSQAMLTATERVGYQDAFLTLTMTDWMTSAEKEGMVRSAYSQIATLLGWFHDFVYSVMTGMISFSVK